MTRIPIVTFATGYGSTVEIDAELFRAAERALDMEARQRETRLASEAAPAEKPAPTTRRIVGLIGARASGFFGG